MKITSLEFLTLGKSTALGKFIDVTLVCKEDGDPGAHLLMLAAIDTFNRNPGHQHHYEGRSAKFVVSVFQKGGEVVHIPTHLQDCRQ